MSVCSSGRADESTIDQKEIDALRAQFETFDADGDGKIEKYEFVEICSAVGLPKDKALELVAEIDDNADGMITFDEYMHDGVLYHLSQAVCKQRTVRVRTVCGVHLSKSVQILHA